MPGLPDVAGLAACRGTRRVPRCFPARPVFPDAAARRDCLALPPPMAYVSSGEEYKCPGFPMATSPTRACNEFHGDLQARTQTQKPHRNTIIFFAQQQVSPEKDSPKSGQTLPASPNLVNTNRKRENRQTMKFVRRLSSRGVCRSPGCGEPDKRFKMMESSSPERLYSSDETDDWQKGQKKEMAKAIQEIEAKMAAKESAEPRSCGGDTTASTAATETNEAMVRLSQALRTCVSFEVVARQVRKGGFPQGRLTCC